MDSVFRGKEIIKPEHHERMFILHGTMETLTAADDKGGTFTQILSSVCKQNGGAVDILEIEKFVFLAPIGAQGVKMLCVCPSMIFLKRTLKRSSRELRACTHASKQAHERASTKPWKQARKHLEGIHFEEEELEPCP